MEITMFKTTECGACKLVEGSGVIDELGIKVVNVTDNPELKPKDMSGAPFFVKLTEGGSIHTHTGFANTQMLKEL